MKQVYLIQIKPLADSDFLLQYGKIVYQTDYISCLYGVESALDLVKELENDDRVKMVTIWNDFNYVI